MRGLYDAMMLIGGLAALVAWSVGAWSMLAIAGLARENKIPFFELGWNFSQLENRLPAAIPHLARFRRAFKVFMLIIVLVAISSILLRPALVELASDI